MAIDINNISFINYLWTKKNSDGTLTGIRLSKNNLPTDTVYSSSLNSKVNKSGDTMTGNLNPSTNKGASLGTSSLYWNNIYGTTIYEGGTSLANKYLGKTAKAADADKLDGNDSTYFQKALPTTTTVGKVLKSTSTAGTVEWGNIGEAFLNWGGKNFSGSYGPIDAAMVPELGANRLAFMPANAVTIEYSRDGGSTWTDYGPTDSQKINLFNGLGSSFTIGKATSGAGNIATNKYQLRVNIYTSTGHVYTVLNKFVIYLSTSGTNNNWCTIRARKQSDYTADKDTWTIFADKISVSGWSGYNVINTSGITTYGNTPSTQYGHIQFIFGCDTGSTNNSYAGLNINKIFGFGGVGWTTPSTMAKTGHMYTYDSSQNVTFPAGVSAKSFTENGKTLSATYIAKSLTSTKGDMIYASAANTPARLGIGSNGQFLSIADGIPKWVNNPNSDTHYVNYLQIKGNGTEAVKFTQNADKSLNLKPGNNVSISAASGEITISSTDTNTWRPLGTGASDACAGNDARLSNARTPIAHTHTSNDVTDALTLIQGKNITLTQTASGIEISAAADGKVKTVNNQQPDSNGNVTVPIPTAGAGLVRSGSAGTYTYKAKLKSETALTVDSAAETTLGKVYPIAVDKSGYLSLNVPLAGFEDVLKGITGRTKVEWNALNKGEYGSNSTYNGTTLPPIILENNSGFWNSASGRPLDVSFHFTKKEKITTLQVKCPPYSGVNPIMSVYYAQEGDTGLTLYKEIATISTADSKTYEFNEEGISADYWVIRFTSSGWIDLKLCSPGGLFTTGLYTKECHQQIMDRFGGYQPIGNYALKGEIPTKSSWNYDDTYVKYTAAQTLTDTQKTQARTNIGAGTITEIKVNGTSKGTSGSVNLTNMVTFASSQTATVAGTSKTTYTYNQPTGDSDTGSSNGSAYFPEGIIMGGTAASAGLVTRGICGVTTPDATTGACNKESLYINYDGNNDYQSNRQLVLQAGSVGTHYGNNLYQYAAARGDAVKGYCDATYVKYTAAQTLTDAQKAQARTNIGAGTSSFTGYTSSNKLHTDYINNAAGWTSNKGTVTSVRVQTGTGLSSSQNTAQTSTLNTTISIASGYKLPTATEWAEIPSINDAYSISAGNGIVLTPSASSLEISVNSTSSVTSGSAALVTSGAVYSAIQSAITTALNTSV